MYIPVKNLKLQLIFTFTICFYAAHSQITFQKVIGSTDYEEAVAVIQTSDLGYIMTGFTYGMGAGPLKKLSLFKAGN